MVDLISISEAQKNSKKFLKEKVKEEGNELNGIDFESSELTDIQIGDEGIGVYKIEGTAKISTGTFGSEEKDFTLQIDAEEGKTRGYDIW